MSVQVHAEEFRHPGSGESARTGVLLVHGFTGSPFSMRPFGEHLANEGFGVAVVRLPGHGTRWQELNTTPWQDWYGVAAAELTRLGKEHDQVFVAGLSMGGCLTLRLAEEQGDGAGGIAGIILVNPSVLSEDKRMLALPVLHRFVPSLAGIGNDIKKPGTDEHAYTRMPLKGLFQLTQLWKVTRADLAKVTQPVALFHSAVDHTVEPSNSREILAAISSRDVTEVLLEDSYHVATLDNDAPRIFADSTAFVRRVSADA